VNTFRRLASKALGVFLTLGPALVIVLLLLALIMLSLGKDPVKAAERILTGTVGSESGRIDVLMAALPMLLCASGLLLTYTAGLWNIGVEGQVTMGAVFATFIALQVTPDSTSPLIVPAELVLAMIGGALWAALAALLKITGNVNEIFGGVALNFISVNVVLSLVNGPWKSGSYPQTKDFAAPAMLSRLADTRLSPLAIVVAVVAFLIIFLVLRGTRWGLQLRAMGRSQKSAFLLGVHTNRNIVLSMMACGALAGLAGALQVLFTRGRLVSGISGGIGFMGVLIVLLVNIQATWVPLVALFLAAVPIGSLKLASSINTAIQVDPSLGNVFQSALVLAVLLANGIRERLATRARSESVGAVSTPVSTAQEETHG
jgi:simple sugar transport system permease protein